MPASDYILEEILCTARRAGASDVHLTAGSPPRMRVRGELMIMEYARLVPAETLDMLLRILPEGQRELFEERGEYDFSCSLVKGGRCRINAYKQRGNVTLVVRLVDAEAPSAEALGLPKSVIDLFRLKQGLVLVTGASGSGRSTTLGALIDQVNTHRSANIITLENPVEYLHTHKLSMVNQREIGIDSRDYVSALRAVLREDADVILVAELVDHETVREAIVAAETGRLVFAAVCAPGITDAIERVTEGFEANGQKQIRMRLANVLQAVVYQELLPSEEGRTAVFEVLHMGDAERKILCEGRYCALNR